MEYIFMITKIIMKNLLKLMILYPHTNYWRQFNMQLVEDSPNVISLNGTSAIGKSTICQLFETRGFHQIDEVFCVDETNNPISFFDHQIDYYLASSARYKKIFMKKLL